MVKIYIEHKLNIDIVNYILQEIFRYINIEYTIIQEYQKADIIYANINNNFKNKIQINPSKQFWNNYKKTESLPSSPLAKKNNVTYIYSNDIIASTFFLLSGYEEYLNPKRDKFNRFLFKYSNYKREDIYLRPLVEQYREILIKQLNNIGIKCKRKNIWGNKEFGLFLTHDVDGVYKYKSTLESIIKIILKPSKFHFKELIRSKKDIKKDPYYNGFKYLINLSNRYNFKSTFFFISKAREKLDYFYRMNDKPIQEAMLKIKENDFEIGLHGSLQSSINRQFLIEEKDMLNLQTHGIRQHYLRYDINITPRLHNGLFLYDTSLCFADMIGFRRGTCLPFKLYDINQDKELKLFEIPLIVMDQTLKGYMRLEPQEAYFKVIQIVEMIKNYNGLFTFLWHSGNCSDEWKIWTKDVYENILTYLSNNKIESKTGKELHGIINDSKKY